MSLGIEIIRRDAPGTAPLEVLRRRAYMRVFRLPRRRLLIVSWLRL